MYHGWPQSYDPTQHIHCFFFLVLIRSAINETLIKSIFSSAIISYLWMDFFFSLTQVEYQEVIVN